MSMRGLRHYTWTLPVLFSEHGQRNFPGYTWIQHSLACPQYLEVSWWCLLHHQPESFLWNRSIWFPWDLGCVTAGDNNQINRHTAKIWSRFLAKGAATRHPAASRLYPRRQDLGQGPHTAFQPPCTASWMLCTSASTLSAGNWCF